MRYQRRSDYRDASMRDFKDGDLVWCIETIIKPKRIKRIGLPYNMCEMDCITMEYKTVYTPNSFYKTQNEAIDELIFKLYEMKLG